LEREAEHVRLCKPKYARGQEIQIPGKTLIKGTVVNRKFLPDTTSWLYMVRDGKGELVEKDNTQWLPDTCIQQRRRLQIAWRK
jgi:hypothetical protein